MSKMARDKNHFAKATKRHLDEHSVITSKRHKNNEACETHEASSKLDRPSDSLLDHIRALGGDECDLDLINFSDSDSGSERVEGCTPKHDRALDRDLATFATTLGLAVPSSSKNLLVSSASTASGRNSRHSLPNLEFDDNIQIVVERPAHTPAINMGSIPKHAFIFPPRTDWHSTPVTHLPPPSDGPQTDYASAIGRIKLYAQSLMEAETERYSNSTSTSSSSRRFLSTIITSGTLQDKVSALTLAIQESPVHNIKAFKSLMGLASKKNRTQATGALGALVDLLGPGSILPPSRKLRTFATQPTLLASLLNASASRWREGDQLPHPMTKTDIIYWLYEDWLKGAYFQVILLLEAWSSDEVEYSRIKGLDFAYCLLKEKPEQEANLLRVLVDKLGDRERRVSSRASYLLLQLQTLHPGMRRVVVEAIDKDLLLDPARCIRARYHAVNTLNQTLLTNKEPGLAKRLLEIYFGLFMSLLKARQPGIVSDDNATPVGKRKARASRPPHGQGMAIPMSSHANTTETIDKLVSAILTGVNRAIPFVSVLDYQSVFHPSVQTPPPHVSLFRCPEARVLLTRQSRLHIHVDTLFRVSHSSNFNTSVQALLLVQKLCGIIPAVTDRFYRTLYESLLDPRLANSSKQAMYLNLLLRSIKADHDTRRVKAFAKRMLQITTLHQAPFVSGILYVVSQTRQIFPDLATLMEGPEDRLAPTDALGHNTEPQGYDGRNRNPEYSNAHRGGLWELVGRPLIRQLCFIDIDLDPSQEPLFAHFHPAVTGAVACASSGLEPASKPDLEHHTLMKFLDKISFKTPKASHHSRGISIMQPYIASEGSVEHSWLGTRSSAKYSAINTPAFWNRKLADVAAEDVFFHRYFSQVPNQHGTNDKSRPMASDVLSDDDEDEIWKALVSAQDDTEEMPHDTDVDDFEDDADLFSDASSFASSHLEDDQGETAVKAAVDTVGIADGLATAESLEGDDLFNDHGSSWAKAGGAPTAHTGPDDSLTNSRSLSKDRRRSLKGLPTFASVDDYEALLAGEDDI